MALMLGGVKKKLDFFAPTLRVKYEFLICIIAFITAACKN